MPTFQDLRIWQEAQRLSLEVYQICRQLPRNERWNLVDQSERSSNSVADNIAEGYGAYHFKDKINRMYDARKEAVETQNHVRQLEGKGYITSEHANRLFLDYEVIIKGINGYIRYLRDKQKRLSSKQR